MTRAATVLVVDDEPPIRELQKRVLTQAGYDVYTVVDADHALQWISEEHPVDLVIADVNMPDVTGDEMARQIRALRPDLKILFVTGFADRLFANQPVLWADQAYLDKPFTQRGLLEAVSLLLHGRLAS
jgi:CheY-like chemotaxis protein